MGKKVQGKNVIGIKLFVEKCDRKKNCTGKIPRGKIYPEK